MKLNDYIRLRRGVASELARELGVAPILISQWARGTRPIPIPRCVAIERATKGAVTRRDLRPEDWQEVWPELRVKGPAHA